MTVLANGPLVPSAVEGPAADDMQMCFDFARHERVKGSAL